MVLDGTALPLLFRPVGGIVPLLRQFPTLAALNQHWLKEAIKKLDKHLLHQQLLDEKTLALCDIERSLDDIPKQESSSEVDHYLQGG